MIIVFWIFAGFAFAFGAVVGSFLNVVILRYPAGESIVYPSSRCPSCGHAIRWYENVPVVSWMALGGRCSACDAPISVQYPLVEAATGLLTFGVWAKAAAYHFEYAPTLHDLPLPAILLPFGFYTVFVGLTVLIAVVDLRDYIVPHAFTVPGIGLGLLHPWLVDAFVRAGHYRLWPPVAGIDSLVGAFAGGLVVLIIYFSYLAARGLEGLGGGDVTLMAFVGAWLGWQSLTFVLFAASLQGLAAALVSRLGDFGWLQSKAEMYGESRATDAPATASEPSETDSRAGEVDPTDPDPDDRRVHPRSERVPNGPAADGDSGPGPDRSPETPTAEDGSNDRTAELPDRNPAQTAAEEADSEPGEAPRTGPHPERDDADEKLAVPFGPFIALAALEHFFLGPYLPPILSSSYLY